LNEALETNYDKLRLSGAKETAVLSAELEAKQLELQQKEDELMRLEQTLIAREKKLEEQEKKLAELNEKLAAQEKATAALKERVSEALRAFENRGLTVEERNGKIYVSLEAKLLFKSGSTVVEAEGKNALIELAKVLESEKDLEIVVEGHTDTDPLKGSTHPINNWELSVLRATSVIDILVANSQMDPSQLMAAGRSEYHPVDPNDKAKNRRIEIIISPDLDALFQLISE
ncbi:MAG: cell envelope biogenesis protein OmpA, partial [Bacteroidetes bacterium]